ncbi:MAG: amino acid permease [Thaumarchaeota archaeon]|nr:amino acid permease [Nitrososphaerota archaeon]
MVALKRDLSLFDLTNIVVGAIIGSDIYIASALTAGLVGPFSVVLWVVAGVMAMILAIIFAYSAYYVPKVGGPFAYVSEAFNDFYGFLAGWSMWIAEVISLPVFAITFANYLQYFVSLNTAGQLAVKAVFLFGLTSVNIFGVRAAGRLNDALTFIKLSPLFLLVVVGFWSFSVNPSFAGNYLPLAPDGFGNLGTALVLIFWAYVGFEMGTLPADEVDNPRRTIPRAIVTGILIVVAFYVTTNFVIFGAVSSDKLAGTTVPLILVGTTLLGTIGGAMMSVGALFSVSGSDESGILGTARLSYALSIDGLFPKAFSKIHKRFGTPYIALAAQGVIAFVLSAFSGLSSLISFSVLNLSFSFLLVSVSFLVLKKKGNKSLRGQNVLPWLGIGVCLFLLYSTSLQDKLVGSAVILAGIPIYAYFSPKVDFAEMKASFLSGTEVTKRYIERTDAFLARLLKLLRRIF